MYQRPRPYRGRPVPRGHPQQPPVVTATADKDQSAAWVGGAHLPRPHGAGRLRPGGLHRQPAHTYTHHQDLEPQPQHTDGIYVSKQPGTIKYLVFLLEKRRICD